ncbi:hypothetical protein EV356DRAFT_454220 [Viridothelium virens]|uniref:Uncharacterized protein n=1 Tax=Viridothelium virens TaxID=1048519 RepID=A0A6A6GX53_VIRVR|nr:hypothetical protein EV356DRAFT_454220 [Viridothelium virens]
MPTGVGKSVLFILPAWYQPSGVIIIIILLIALQGYMWQQCKQLGIKYAE